MTDSFIGQTAWRKILSDAAAQGRLAHTYVVAGPAHIGKRTFADDFARQVVCATGAACGACASCLAWRGNDHPDVVILLPEKDRVSVDEVRAFAATLQQTASVASHRFALIPDADKLSVACQNILLKMLEEPPRNTIFCLLADAVAGLLPTVRSRAEVCVFAPVPVSEMVAAFVARGIDQVSAEKYARAALGCPGRAVTWIDDPDSFTVFAERVKELLDLATADRATQMAFTEQFAKEQEGADVHETLGLWHMVLRDIVLAAAGSDAFAFSWLKNDIIRTAARRSSLAWVAAADAVALADERLAQYANRRLALNSLFLSL